MFHVRESREKRRLEWTEYVPCAAPLSCLTTLNPHKISGSALFCKPHVTSGYLQGSMEPSFSDTQPLEVALLEWLSGQGQGSGSSLTSPQATGPQIHCLETQWPFSYLNTPRSFCHWGVCPYCSLCHADLLSHALHLANSYWYSRLVILKVWSPNQQSWHHPGVY